MTMIRLRRGTSAQWVSADTVLEYGEPGWDGQARAFKIGDGVTPWTDLDPVAGTYPSHSAVVEAAYELWLAEGNTGTLEDFVQQSTAAAYGFVIDTGATPPAVTQVDGYPVIWVPDQSTLTLVPTVPTAPSWNLASFTVTPPVVVGVQYELVDGATYTPLAQGVATSLAGFPRPYVATVRAVALPGYALTSTYQWQQLFYDASLLTLWASESFAGAAGTVLCPANSVPGRTFDMAGGGSASGAAIPEWFRANATEPSGWKIDGTGTKALRNDGAGVPVNNGTVQVDSTAANHALEIDITAFPIRHSRGLAIYIGADSDLNPRAQVMLYINSTACDLRFENQAGLLTTHVYRTGVTEAMMLGTWRFAWVNKALQVNCPDGQAFTYDYSAQVFPFSTTLGLAWSDFGTAPAVAPTLDNVRVYK